MRREAAVQGRPRIAPPARPRRARLDLVLLAAMIAVPASYALGYRLDWSQEEADIPALYEEEEEPAPAAAAAPVRPSAPAAPDEAAPSIWAPNPEAVDWERMTVELSALAARQGGRVAIMLKDMHSQREWSHHPDDLFPAASLIKVPVMIAAFYRVKAGELSLGDRLVLRRRVRVGGSGSLKWRPDGTRVTVEELLVRMINESDNTATAMLLDTLGIGYAQQQFQRMGLLYTNIYQEGMSLKGGWVAHENYTTAREMSMLLEKIYRGEAVDSSCSAAMLEILRKRKAVPSRLAKGLPPGWEIAHKTGLLRQACHDAAIFFTPHGDYVMTVLTGRNRSYQDAKDFISRLGSVTFRYYTGTDRLPRGSARRRQVASR